MPDLIPRKGQYSNFADDVDDDDDNDDNDSLYPTAAFEIDPILCSPVTESMTTMPTTKTTTMTSTATLALPLLATQADGMLDTFP